MRDEQKSGNITERVAIACAEIFDYIKGLVAEGKVRRLIVYKPDGKVLLDVPLITGAAASGLLVIFAPVLAAIGAIAALVAKVQVEVEVVRDDHQD